MSLNLRLILIFGFIFLPLSANSFELATHASITRAAFYKSILKDATFRSNLGVLEAESQLSEVYYDVDGDMVIQRLANADYEGAIIETIDEEPLSLPGWLMRGAIREDDLGYLLGFKKVGSNPYDDPYGDIFRVFNHFFDPYYDRALSYVPGAQKNPNWAIGSSNAFNDPNTPEEGRRNHFTVFDAREAMYRALTGKRLDGTNATPNASDTNPASHDVRKAWWATTFRALGDTLHLNQDMAQPQHTRNEPHSGKGGWLAEEIYTGHASVMEDYATFNLPTQGRLS